MRPGGEPSDPVLVVRKRANPGSSAPAELVERRAGAQGNPADPSPRRASNRGRGSPAVERIRLAAKRKPKQKRVSWWLPLPGDARPAADLRLKRQAASGVDGGTGGRYANGRRDR